MKYFVFLALLMSGCSCEKKVILDVGACDADAWCQVRYTDGTLGYQRYPVAGKEAAECR